MQLEQSFPDYYSKYSMVTFRPDIGYREAMIKGRKQDEYLLSLYNNGNKSLDEIYYSVMKLT
jgi:kynurenine 3-monooxygenase